MPSDPHTIADESHEQFEDSYTNSPIGTWTFRFICIGMEDSVNSSMEFSSTTCRDTYIDLDTN